jgi:hypothetical protein
MELGLNKLDQINNFEINEKRFDTICKRITKIIKEHPDEFHYVKCYLFIPTYFTFEIARHIEQQLSFLIGNAPEIVPFHSIFNKYLIQENSANYLDHINHFVLLEHFNDKIYLSLAEKGSAYAKSSSQFAFKLNSNITESKEMDNLVIAKLIAKIMDSNNPLSRKADQLIDCANDNGGRDNISVILASYQPELPQRSWLNRWLGKNK